MDNKQEAPTTDKSQIRNRAAGQLLQALEERPELGRVLHELANK